MKSVEIKNVVTKSWLFILTTLLFFSITSPALASIYIVYPENTSAYKNIANTLKERLNKQGTLDVKIVKNSKTENNNINNSNLIVYLGNNHIEESHKNTSTPAIFSFATEENIEQHSKHDEWSAVNINQPIERLLKTAERTITKEYKKKLLFVVSAENSLLIEKLEKIKTEKNIQTITVKENQIAAKLIEPELSDTAAIVAIYDPKIWSGNSARWMLQQAYTHKVPIIGYSKAFLKAGAMVSVYSSAEQIIQETETQINQWIKTKKLNNTIIYPEYSIEVNNHIAKSLKFTQNEIIEIGKKQ